MTSFHTDQPIDGTANRPDLLGREEYAKRIGAALLLQKDMPGIVVSIEGEWGYGKTSFLNLVTKYYQSLSDGERPIVVSFSPWMVSGVENLAQEFLVQLASNIGISDSAEQAQNAAIQVLSYSKVFTALKFIPGAEPWASIVQGVMEGVGEAADSIGNLKELSIEDKRDKVTSALSELDKPIVIFIDDIDRLPPEEVFDIVRLVKAVADFPRVSFVLAYDPIYVGDALSEFGIQNGAAYLDKIVQSRVHLPVAHSKDVESIVNSELKKLPQEATKDYFPEGENRLSDLYHSSVKFLLRSPRDVKRLFNRLYISEIACRGEVSFPDLFALEVMAIKAPKLFEHVRKNPEAYTGVPANVDFLMETPEEHVQSRVGERNGIFDELKEDEKKHWRDLINKLFPLTDEHGFHHNQKYCSARGWIAATDRLMIALSYGMPSDEVPLTTVRSFLESDEDRDQILKSIIVSDKLERFIDHMRLLIDEIELSNQARFVSILSGLTEKEEVAKIDERQKDVLSTKLVKQIWWLLEARLEKIDQAQRIEVIRGLITNSEEFSLGTYGMVFLLRQHGFYDQNVAVAPDRQWCTEEELEDLKEAWKCTVKEAIDSGSFCSLNARGEIIFLLRRLDADLARELVGAMIADNEKIDCVMFAFGESGSDSVKGRYSHVTNDVIESFGDVDEIRGRAQARLDSKTPPDMPLEAVYKSIVTGKKIYLIDGNEGEPF